MPIQHTEECNNQWIRYRLAVAAYEKAHPHYCRVCGGSGLDNGGYDNGAPHGEGYWAMPVAAGACPACIGAGKCPWCGGEEESDDLGSCPCGWNNNSQGFPENVYYNCDQEP